MGEARLRKLESANAMPADVGEQVKKLQLDFRALDISDLTRIRPDVSLFQKQREALSEDLTREVKELKCLVGCMEACIPRETRKAVQLFKRAAGSTDQAPASPRDFYGGCSCNLCQLICYSSNLCHSIHHWHLHWCLRHQW